MTLKHIAHAAALSLLALALPACHGDSGTGPGASTIKSGTVALEAPVKDLVYDEKRNVLYLSEPAFSQVGVLSLTTLTYGPPIPVGPSRPSGIDITPDGDALLVARTGSPFLGRIDLTGASPSLDTIRLTSGSSQWPDHVRVMANGKAFVTMTFAGSGFGGNVMEVDVGRRTARLRADVGYGGSVTEAVPLARSHDRSRMLVLIDDSCCPLTGFVYNATTDQFSSGLATVSRFFPSVATDSTGSRYQIGGSLFSGTLTLLETYTPTGYQNGPAALSPNGATGYFAAPNGVLVVRMSDGVVTTTLPLPGPPTQLYVLPSGKALISTTGAELQVFLIGP